MARRRKSEPTTAQARDLALAIRQGERLGLKQRDIAETLGINERTVRKIKSGQTPGTRTYARVMHEPKTRRSETGLFNAEFVIGTDASGNEIIGSRNVTIPVLTTASGEMRAATPLDVFRIRGLATVLAQERMRLARKYGNVDRISDDPTIRLRAISTARRRTTIVRTATVL